MGFSKDCGLMATDRPQDPRAGVLVRRETEAPYLQRALLCYYTHTGGPTYDAWVEANSNGEVFMETDAGNKVQAASNGDASMVSSGDAEVEVTSDGDVIITLGN